MVSWKGVESRFDHRKLTRERLYGKRSRVTLDPLGATCARAELTTDGDLLVRSGMTAQAYFDEAGNQYAIGDLMAFDAGGEPMEKTSSTLGVAQELEGPVDPAEVLDLGLGSVFMLTPEELDDGLAGALLSGDVFRFSFKYRTDYQPDTAFLVGTDHGFFALIGRPVVAEWIGLDQQILETFDDSDDDDLDFDMF